MISEDSIALAMSQFVDLNGREIGCCPDYKDLMKFARAIESEVLAQPAPIAPQAVDEFIAAADDFLESCSCDCSDSRRYDKGEHLSSCFLFDFDIAHKKYKATAAPRFIQTYCSQCGAELGPGNSGVSHCSDHAAPTANPAPQAVDVIGAIPNSGNQRNEFVEELMNALFEYGFSGTEVGSFHTDFAAVSMALDAALTTTANTPAVPDEWREDVHLAAQMLSWGREERLTEQQDAAIRAHEKKLFRTLATPSPVQERVEPVVEFAREVISGALNGSTFDGADIQELGFNLGLLDLYEPTEPCGENCNCREFEFPLQCYRMTKLLATPPSTIGDK